MKTHNCTNNGATGVHTFSRKYLGNGRYLVKGLCQGIADGDDSHCFTAHKTFFKVDKVLSITDAKANNWPAEKRKNAFFEAEMIDVSFLPNDVSYRPYNLG